MDGTCRFHAALVDEQVLSHIRENDITDLSRRTALLQRDNGTPEQRSVGFLGKPARRNIHGLIADRERVQIRLEFLVDVPHRIRPRSRPQSVPHGDEVVDGDDSRLVFFLCDLYDRTAVQDSERLALARAEQNRIVDLEPELFRECLANDRFESRRILQEFIRRIAKPRELLERQFHLAELGLACRQFFRFALPLGLDTAPARSVRSRLLIDGIDFQSVCI